MISMIALEKTHIVSQSASSGLLGINLWTLARKGPTRGVAIVHLSSAQLYRDHSKPL